MLYYLIGEEETYPNLRLSLWSEIETFNKTDFGKMKLQGNLELRVDDWVDYDENNTAFDNHLIEMGWNFRNSSDLRYDGIKVKFLYNTEHTHDPR